MACSSCPSSTRPCWWALPCFRWPGPGICNPWNRNPWKFSRLFAAALHGTWMMLDLQHQREFLREESRSLKVRAEALDQRNQALRQGQSLQVDFLAYAAKAGFDSVELQISDVWPETGKPEVAVAVVPASLPPFAKLAVAKGWSHASEDLTLLAVTWEARKPATGVGAA